MVDILKCHECGSIVQVLADNGSECSLHMQKIPVQTEGENAAKHKPIIEIDGDNTNTNEWVKTWVYKQLRLIAQLFKIEKLYDYIDVEFTHVGPENLDNYLIVFDIVSRKILADSAKQFLLHFTVLGAIVVAVCACIFLF